MHQEDSEGVEFGAIVNDDVLNTATQVTHYCTEQGMDVKGLVVALSALIAQRAYLNQGMGAEEVMTAMHSLGLPLAQMTVGYAKVATGDISAVKLAELAKEQGFTGPFGACLDSFRDAADAIEKARQESSE